MALADLQKLIWKWEKFPVNLWYPVLLFLINYFRIHNIYTNFQI
jgi:hypothetical protein